ncbi:sugar ABC transporter ATP-binding protein [Tranquillimonas alkanivorans]|uniref:Ribose ABC transporter ATP-binding protein n=1 Tax=Tranquillimonas alkanivorans TaxID=441119 RepID=A0A1I5V7I1_9RHOB|nr:sugar ABC transporter ATP-binding protein [Tranquillimonas alkanivorans]SFQ03494.1 ribose ABC transporter ATP-binding protein [Tranquillimonas alkanivorans]
MTDELLQAQALRKQFGNNVVLRDVDLSVGRGEVHAIVGENGAGKSTLIKILGGVHRADGGTMKLEGRELILNSPQAALDQGIVVIHQELSLAPDLTTEENIFLGHFPRNALGLLDRRRMRERTRELLDRLSIEIDPTVPVGQLSIAQQQMIEIAKAISVEAKMLVLDEPTAVLDANRVDTLFDLVERLKAQGIGIVFISHHLEEIFRIADRVTVLRDGERTGTSDVSAIDQDWLVSKMIGREFEAHHTQARGMGEVALELEELSSEGAFENVSFSVRAGEIVGLAGLIGAGRTEVAQAIFGVRPHSSGQMKVFGRPTRFSGPGAAKRQGIAYVSEDRKAFGLLPNRPVRENATISNLARFRSLGLLRLDRERAFVREQIEQLDIRLPSMQAEISTLSGGNQQKVLLGRALAGRPRVLIFDEPTRGVDIGAKREIYRFIEELAEDGVAIIVISSEMEEVLRLSDRVLVMRGGRVAAELPRGEATEESVMRAASLD